MRSFSLVTLASLLTFVAGGCATDSSVAPSPTAPSPVAAQPAKAQPFQKPLVPAKPGGASAVSGLVQPTNADERARQVQAGINARQNTNDPFSSIPPVVNNRTPLTARRAPVPRLPNPRGRAGQDFNRGRGNLLPPSGQRPPTLPNNNNTRNPITNLPPLPEPDLARSVEVTGVVDVAGVINVIVRAPGEGSTRYVRVGQRLSNGQVLVKRVEMNRGPEPVVILEQNGVEVAKTVGESNKPSQQATALERRSV